MEAPPSFDFDPPRRKRRWLRVVGMLGIIIVVFAGGVTFWAYRQAKGVTDKFHEGEKGMIVARALPELEKKPRKPAKGIGEATTYLLVGSDARPGDTASRSDTTLLVRVYPDEKIASILSIPRDIWVDIPGYGENRINAAYAYGGVPLLIETLREWTGVRIDHFFAVDFSSFAGVVDNLDGVYLPIDQDYHHVNDGTAENNWAEIDVDHGYQKLYGDEALEWVRFRHLDSDFHRAARQQIFLREAGRQLRKQSLTGLKPIIEAVAEGITSDIGTGTLIKLANTLREIPSERIVRLTMPGDGTMINGASVLLTSDEDKANVIKAWTRPSTLIETQKQKPNPGLKFKQKQGLLEFLQGRVRPVSDDYADLIGWIRKREQVLERKRAARHVKRKPRGLIDNPLPVIPVTRAETCRPMKLPEGYMWPDDPTRNYRLNGYPAASSYATRSSGDSILWMWTDWLDPPILDSPSDAARIGGVTYQMFWEGDTLRMVSWSIGNSAAWIQNTLQNSLSKDEMLDLATSC